MTWDLCEMCFFLTTVLHETRTNKITQIPSHADSPKSDHFYLLGWHCQQNSSKSQVTLIHWELFSRARSIQTYTVAHNSQVMRYPHTCHYSVDLAHLVNKIPLNPKSSWFLEFCFTRHVLFKHTHTHSHTSPRSCGCQTYFLFCIPCWLAKVSQGDVFLCNPSGEILHKS